MDTYIFFLFIVLSSWPLFYSFVLYYSAKYMKFEVFISSKRHLYRYLLYLALYIIMFSFLFFSRILRRDRIVDINVVYEAILAFMGTTLPSTLLLLGLCGIIWIIFFILLVRWLTKILKNLLIALYVYFYQYEISSKLAIWVCEFDYNLWMFLSNSVLKYTKNAILQEITYYIWPWFFWILEKFVHRYILIYLWIYDYMVNYGHLNKIFQVLPWYFLYTLLKAFYNQFQQIDHEIFYWELSQKFYGGSRKVKIKEFAWISVLLKIYEKLKKLIKKLK